MVMKRFLIISAAAAILLISSTVIAHRAASDDEEASLVTGGDINANIPGEEVPFIENLSPKGDEEDVYQGPKDFQYCNDYQKNVL
jgi:hypothetical protein